MAMMYSKIALLHVFIIAFVVQLLLSEHVLYAEAPSANNSPSATNASLVLEKKIYQLVEDLDYSDQVASDFVKMIYSWKCDVLYQKLNQASEDIKQKKISWSQYAQTEEEVVNQLAQTIRNKIAIVDTVIESNQKYVDLDLVVKDKKANCLSYAQLFYVLGNSMGYTGPRKLDHEN